jgi:uncharacterized protein (TIGR04255 family)
VARGADGGSLPLTGDEGSALPDFDRPPVNEVVLSAGFLDVPGLHAGQLGRYWDAIRDEFPNGEEQAPYDLPIEPLDPFAVTEPSAELVTAYPPPRLWLRSVDGEQLIQVQRNWFAFNWRRQGPEETSPYPRYPAVEERFTTQFRRLVDFIEAEGLGDVMTTQCEVTYINHIELPGPGFAGTETVLTMGGLRTSAFLPPTQRVRLDAAFTMTRDDQPYGRLHVSAQPALRRSDNRPILMLNLTARGYPVGDGEDGVVNFLRLGREWVVRGFADVTTPEMHERWGRRD